MVESAISSAAMDRYQTEIRNRQGERKMTDDQQREADKRADKHIAEVKRKAGEAAHVEGVEYEANAVEADPPLSNIEASDQDTTDEGAPLEAPDTDTDSDQ
jgi:hypothetical protein